MKQTHFIKNATSACVFLCVIALLSFTSSPAAAAAADTPDTVHPRIYSLTGIVEARPGSDTPWQRLNKGDTIPPGSTIAAEPDAGAILLIGRSALLHVFGETEFSFEELPAQTGGAAKGAANAAKTKTAIALGAGQIYLSVSQLPTPDSTFTIETPSALASVRGNAEFLIKLHDNGDTTLAVESGRLIAGSQGIEILLDPGYQTTIEPGMPPAEIHTILPMDATALEAESRAANAIAVASTQSAPQLSSSADGRTSFQLVKTSTNTTSASSSATSPVGAHGRAPSATDTAKAAATSTPQFSSSTESESRTSFQFVKTSTDTAGSASNTAATTATATATTTATPARTIESLITQAEKTAPKQNKPPKTQAKTPEHAKPTPDSGNTGKTNNDNINNNEIKNDKKPEAATPEIKSADQTDEDKLHDEIAEHLNELLNNR